MLACLLASRKSVLISASQPFSQAISEHCETTHTGWCVTRYACLPVQRRSPTYTNRAWRSVTTFISRYSKPATCIDFVRANNMTTTTTTTMMIPDFTKRGLDRIPVRDCWRVSWRWWTSRSNDARQVCTCSSDMSTRRDQLGWNWPHHRTDHVQSTCRTDHVTKLTMSSPLAELTTSQQWQCRVHTAGQQSSGYLIKTTFTFT